MDSCATQQGSSFQRTKKQLIWSTGRWMNGRIAIPLLCI